MGDLVGDHVGDHEGVLMGDLERPTVLMESRLVPAMDRAGMGDRDRVLSLPFTVQQECDSGTSDKGHFEYRTQ